MSIGLFISIVTCFILIVLSLFVLSENRQSKIHKIFCWLCISISIWIMSNILAYITNSPIFFLRFAIVGAVFIPILLNDLIINLYHHTNTKYILRHKILTSFSLLTSIIIIFLNQTRLNITSIKFESWGIAFQPGALYYLLFVYLVITFLCSSIYLIQAIKISSEPQKSQAKLILTGCFISIPLILNTNIIFPLLGNSFPTVFGPTMAIFFITFISIAILKHSLFNIKLIAIELVTFSLWIFMLVRTLLAENVRDLMIEGSIFLITVFFGIILIRNVLHEIRQRKNIAELTDNLRQAYAQIKVLGDKLEEKEIINEVTQVGR